MKPTLLFLALATALFGQEAEQKKETSPAIAAGTNTSIYLKAEEKFTTGGITINMRPESIEVFAITGIPQVQLSSDLALFQYPQFRRPVKADEVVVHVWTADGKKWRARWEEAKQ